MTEKKIICNLNIDEIKELAESVRVNGLDKISIRNEYSEIIIMGKNSETASSVTIKNVDEGITQKRAGEVLNDITKKNGNVVKAPIVGTFYSSPAPDKPPFVKIGDTVKKGDVIMIIESMKLMNEIQSDFDGTVLDILVDNGQAVEYEQPIMIIG